MAKAKKAVRASRSKEINPAPINIKAKTLRIGVDIGKYMGYEPVWEGVEITEANRKVMLIDGFNWYNYSFGAKDAHAFIVEYLTLNDRKDEAKQFKKAKDRAVSNALGWMARMTMMGWVFDEDEAQRVNAAIAHAIESVVHKAEEVAEEPAKAKFNIQEVMREKSAEAGGELEGMLDEYIANGAPAKHNFKPVDVLKKANILPAHVGVEVEYWTNVAAEFKAAHGGKDTDLSEGYSKFSKIQLRNLAKFAELIVNDYHGYVAFKKANKKVRPKKVKTPDQLAFKLKFLKEDKALKLTSIKPSKIVGAKEVFAYDVKKRKLMYLIADEYSQTLTIKNNTIVGFDTTKSVQKTVRKPAEQLKGFMTASRPDTRKLFKNTKSVEIKVSGRFNENIIILKAF